MWTGGIRVAQESPIIGGGLGNFQLIFPSKRPSYYHRSVWNSPQVSHNTRHAHCEYMEHLMETGFAGLGLFLLILVTYVREAWYVLQHCKDRFWRFVYMGFVAGFFGTLAHNLVSVNLRWTSTGFAFYFAIGLVPGDTLPLAGTTRAGSLQRVNHAITVIELHPGGKFGCAGASAAAYRLGYAGKFHNLLFLLSGQRVDRHRRIIIHPGIHRVVMRMQRRAGKDALSFFSVNEHSGIIT